MLNNSKLFIKRVDFARILYLANAYWESRISRGIRGILFPTGHCGLHLAFRYISYDKIDAFPHNAKVKLPDPLRYECRKHIILNLPLIEKICKVMRWRFSFESVYANVACFNAAFLINTIPKIRILRYKISNIQNIYLINVRYFHNHIEDYMVYEPIKWAERFKLHSY